MAKAISSYICQECGAQSPVMMGKCPRCGSWNSMEAKQEGTSSKTRRRDL
ncbi:MAG: hypothetical protein R2865_05440 [Deinococcales bacterium]